MFNIFWTNENSYRNHLSLNSKLTLTSQNSHLKFIKHAAYSVWFTYYTFAKMWQLCTNTLLGSGFVFGYLLWCLICNLIMQSDAGQNIYPLGDRQRLRLLFCFNSQRRKQIYTPIWGTNNAITTQTCYKVPSPSITDNKDFLYLPKSFWSKGSLLWLGCLEKEHKEGHQGAFQKAQQSLAAVHLRGSKPVYLSPWFYYVLNIYNIFFSLFFHPTP